MNNNKIIFDGKGKEAEQLAIRQFNGREATDLQDQYKDIDVFIKDKQGVERSVSIKDQVETTKTFPTVQLELELINTDNNQSTDGCFYNNESDYYMWRVTYQGVVQWAVMSSKRLKEWVATNLPTVRHWATRSSTEAYNKRLGRTYNRSTGILFPLDCVNEIGHFIVCKEY